MFRHFVLVLFPFLIQNQISFSAIPFDQEGLRIAIFKAESELNLGRHEKVSFINKSCYLSNLYLRAFQYRKSEKLLVHTMSILNDSTDYALKAIVYNQLGETYKLCGDFAQSYKNYVKALELFRLTKNYLGLVKVQTDFAEYYRNQGKYDEAKYHIYEALYTYRKNTLNDNNKLIRIYNRSAAIHNETNAIDSSLHYSILAIQLAREIGDKYSEAVSYNEIGFSMKNLVRVDSAMNCYKRAIMIWNQLGADADAIHGNYNIAMLLSHNSISKKEILPYYKEIIKVVTEKNIDYPLDRVYFDMSHCYFFMGDSLNCYRIRQKAFEALLAKNQKLFDVQVHNIKEKYENEKYKAQLLITSNKLNNSLNHLKKSNREKLIMILLLLLFAVILAIIIWLVRKIHASNKVLNLKHREKDSLIQEIHHRVKNNLQMVISLLNMQIKTATNLDETKSLNDASRRINSMSLVHQMLYNSDDVKGVEIRHYLNELIRSIDDSINSIKIPIHFKVECEEWVFEATTAQALGMITSELVSNSIKYAFNNSQNPEIKLSLKKINMKTNEFEFVLRDNGSGLLHLPNLENPEKLGMRLVGIFSKQIKGKFNIYNESGLVFSLRFIK